MGCDCVEDARVGEGSEGEGDALSDGVTGFGIGVDHRPEGVGPSASAFAFAASRSTLACSACNRAAAWRRALRALRRSAAGDTNPAACSRSFSSLTATAPPKTTPHGLELARTNPHPELPNVETRR